MYTVEEQLAYARAHGLEEPGFFIDPHRLFGATSGGDLPVKIEGDCGSYIGVMEGLNPDDPSQLLRNGSRDLVDHEKLISAEERIFGLDTILSAPRGVSLLYAFGDEPTRRIVLEEFRAALDAAIGEIDENYIWARRGHGGVDKERGKALFSAFLHKAARPTETGSIAEDASNLSKLGGFIGDPHLHYHIIIPSYVQRSDGSFVTMDTRMFADGAIKAVGKAASLRLAEGLRRRLGVDMEEIKHKQPDGTEEIILDVAGMQDLVQAYSKRSRFGHKALADEVALNPAIADDPQRMKMLHKQALVDQRLGKNNTFEIAGDDRLFRENTWQELGRRDGFDLAAVINRPPPVTEDAVDLDDQTEQALAQAFESDGVISTGHLHQALYKAHLVHGTRDGAMAAKARLIESRRLIELGLDGKQGWTTKIQVETEEKVRVLAAEFAGAASTRFQIGVDKIAAVLAKSYQSAAASGFEVDDVTRDEQAKALRHLVSTTAMIAVMEGAAGTGKSHVFSLAAVLYRAEGKEMIALALAHETARDLGQKCKCPATAVDAFLKDLEKGKRRLTAETVIMIDEAGQVGACQMMALLVAAQASGAKIMLTGDRLQVKPVSAGGGLDLVVREAGSVRLENSVRAREVWAREAATLLSQGQGEEAIALFRRAGRVHLIDGANAAAASRATREAALAGRQAYAADIANDGKTHLLMSATNAGVEQMAATIRQQMIESGALGRDTLTIRVVDRDEQKRRKQRVRRRKSDPDPKSQGRGRREPRKDLEIRLGEQLRFGLRDDRLGVVNGTVGKVVGWGPNDDGELRLRVEIKGVVDRTIHIDPVEYGALRHNYASTVYSAQGATVGYAGVIVDGESWKRDGAYVAGSRARDETHFFVNRRELERQVKEQLPFEQRRGFRATDEELLRQLGSNLSRISRKENATDWLDRRKVDSWAEAEKRWIPSRAEGEKRVVPDAIELRRKRKAEKQSATLATASPDWKPEPTAQAAPAATPAPARKQPSQGLSARTSSSSDRRGNGRAAALELLNFGGLPGDGREIAVKSTPEVAPAAPEERRKRGRPRKEEAGARPSAKKVLSFKAIGNKSVRRLKIQIAGRPTLRAKLLPIAASIAPRRIDHAALHAFGHLGPGLALSQAGATEAAAKAAVARSALPAPRRWTPARPTPGGQLRQAGLSPEAVKFVSRMRPEQLEVAVRTSLSGLLNLVVTARDGGVKAEAARANLVQVRERVLAIIDRTRAEKPDAIERLPVAYRRYVEELRPAPKAQPMRPPVDKNDPEVKALARVTKRYRLARAVEKLAMKLHGAKSAMVERISSLVRALGERVGFSKTRVAAKARAQAQYHVAQPTKPAIKGPTLKRPSL